MPDISSFSLLVDAALKGTLVLLAATVLALALRRGSAASRHVIWLDIRLDYENRTVTGTALMRLRNHTLVPVSEIPLQLGRLMAVDAVMTEDNAPLSFTHDIVRFSDWPARQMNQLYVRLPHALAPGDSFAVRVAWNGTLVGYTETGMGYVRERVDTMFTILRNEAGAFPVIAVPNSAANRAAPRPDFDYVVRVTVPSRQTVALGGELVSTDKRAGLTTWEYRSIKPAPFINIAIAPYEVTEQDALRIFYFPSDSAGALQLQAALTRALALLAHWFGPMGDSLPVIVTEIPNGYGSQASLYSGIILEARAFNDPKRRGELYHELSHLWNAPDRDSSPPRWNEGLAGFMEDLLMERLDNWDGRHAYTQKYAMQYLDGFAEDSVNLRTPLIDYGRTGRTDSPTAWATSCSTCSMKPSALMSSTV